MTGRLKRLAFIGNGYPLGAVAVLAAAVLLLPFRSTLEVPVVLLVFVPVIIVLARTFGVGVSTMASVLAFFTIDFLFLPPYYRLVVGSLPEWIGLLTFLAVALVAGNQTGVLRRREQAALRRQAELELVNAISQRIISATSGEEVAHFVVQQAQSALGAKRVALYVSNDDSAPALLASAGSNSRSQGEEVLVGQCVRRGAIVDSEPVDGQRRGVLSAESVSPGVHAEGLYLPLSTSSGVEGVLHLAWGESEPGRSAADSAVLAAVCNLVSASIERERLEQEASKAEALREADKLRTTLVSSVSHELKTPLAAATARITGLLEEETRDPARTLDELREVESDLSRLNSSIGDLLDLSRLESDAWRPEFESHEVSEVLGTVLARMAASDKARLHFSLADDDTSICCDFAQLSRALTNLIENALVYSPPAAAVNVSTRLAGDEVLISVEDCGPGVSELEKQRVFEKFYRGSSSGAAPGGTGLGLTIAFEVVQAHRGKIWIEDALPRGARFVVALPVDGCESKESNGIA